MDKISQLKQTIQQAVPSIMELKAGCQFVYTFGGKDEIFTITDDRGVHSYYTDEFRGFGCSCCSLDIANKDIKEILGRPIRLADVLVAMAKIDKCTISFLDGNKTGINEELGRVLMEWQIKDDNLDHQSPETIDFLHAILCN